jgi:hypothetical protein
MVSTNVQIANGAPLGCAFRRSSQGHRRPDSGLYHAGTRAGSLADDKQGEIVVAQCVISGRTEKLLHLTGLGGPDDY